MESFQDRTTRIAKEGLRLVLQCKTPRFCPSAGSSTLVVQQQQQEWLKRIPETLPPLLDWIERYRQMLFDVEKLVPTAVQEFQQWFSLVYLEQSSRFQKKRFDAFFAWELRLYSFDDDVEKILSTNTAIQSWLFHYYGSELGLQGWQSRPGDLCSLNRLVDLLHGPELDVLFGQKMFSFLENLAKELMRFQEYSVCQSIGTRLMYTVVETYDKKQIYSIDTEEILQLALQVNRKAEVSVDDEDYLWWIIYHCIKLIRNAKNPSCSSDEEIMLGLLAQLNEELMKKECNPNYSLNAGQLALLRAVTLLLLLDVPEVDIRDGEFDFITISGNYYTDDKKFRRHVKSHLRRATGDDDNRRFSIHIRLRIAKMIPKLCAGFATTYYVNMYAYRCLELLTWMTMFPVNGTRQRRNALAIMLKRLEEEIRRTCENYLNRPWDYSLDDESLNALYGCLYQLLVVVRDGIKELPNSGWFRRYKCDMRMRIAGLLFKLEALNRSEDLEY